MKKLKLTEVNNSEVRGQDLKRSSPWRLKSPRTMVEVALESVAVSLGLRLARKE